MEQTSIIPIPPIPRCPIAIRPATQSDLPFIDTLQKMHSHMVGFLHREALEGKIAAGHVLIAESWNEGMGGEGLGCRVSGVGSEEGSSDSSRPIPQTPHPKPSPPIPIGYVIAQDQYMKRDDVGIVYQLNVMPVRQRHLVGASLVKAAFERAAYGCRLFCCWCAQDLQANFFWESLGFVPLAFRAGSRGKQRIHIFWQRRIREDDFVTPWWYPFQTSQGQIREDRIVLPIPPGVHWRDAKPLVLPGMEQEGGELKPLAIAEKREKARAVPAPPSPMKLSVVRSQSKHLKGLPDGKAAVITSGGVRYVDRGDYVPEAAAPAPVPEKVKRPRKEPSPNDLKMVAQARELRDRFLEQINSGTFAIEAKYSVGKAIECRAQDKSSVTPPKLIDHAEAA